MKETHRGKIGRLPQVLQEQVNRRLRSGERACALVAWLNSLPEVQALLTAEFQGKPVREQNVSEWRHHGYQGWLRRQEALELAHATAAAVGSSSVSAAPSLTGPVVNWISVRYLLAVRSLVHQPGAGPDLKILRDFCQDVVALRRGEHRAARLQLDRERLAQEPRHSVQQLR